MFCSNCGKKIGNEIKFCPHCGKAAVVEEVTKNNVNIAESVEVSKDKAVVRNEEKVTKKTRRNLKSILNSKPVYALVILMGIILVVHLWNEGVNGTELSKFLKYGTEKDADDMHELYQNEDESLFHCVDGKICAISLNADSAPEVKVRLCGISLGDSKEEVEEILDKKFEELETIEQYSLYKEIKTGYQLMIEYTENDIVKSVNYMKNADGTKEIMEIYSEEIEEPIINFNCTWNKNSTVEDDMYAVAKFTEDGKVVCIESFGATSGRGIAMFEGTYVGKDDFRDIYENEEYGYITLCTSMNGIYIEGFPKDEHAETYHFIGITGEYYEEVATENDNQIQYEGTAGIVQLLMDYNVLFVYNMYYGSSLPTTGEVVAKNLERCTNEYFSSYQEYVDFVHMVYVNKQADYFIGQAKYFNHNGIFCLNTAFESGYEGIDNPWNTYTINILSETDNEVIFEVTTKDIYGTLVKRQGTMVGENGYWKLTEPVW